MMITKNLPRLITFSSREQKLSYFCNNINSMVRYQQPRRNYSDNLPKDKWLTKKIFHAINTRISSKLKVFDGMCKNLNTKATTQVQNYNTAIKKAYTSDKLMKNKYFLIVFKGLCTCRTVIQRITCSPLFLSLMSFIQARLLQLLRFSIECGKKILLKYEKGELTGTTNVEAIKKHEECCPKMKKN